MSISFRGQVGFTGQKMKFSIKDFLWIWSHLPKKSLMENFIHIFVENEDKQTTISF